MNHVIPVYFVPCYRVVSIQLAPPPIAIPPPVKVTRPSKRLEIKKPTTKFAKKLNIDLAIDAPLAPISMLPPRLFSMVPLFDFNMSTLEFQTFDTAVNVAASVLND